MVHFWCCAATTLCNVAFLLFRRFTRFKIVIVWTYCTYTQYISLYRVYIAWFRIVSLLLCFTCLAIPIIDSRCPRPIGMSYQCFNTVCTVHEQFTCYMPGLYVHMKPIDVISVRNHHWLSQAFTTRLTFLTNITDINLQFFELFPALILASLPNITILQLLFQIKPFQIYLYQ